MVDLPFAPPFRRLARAVAALLFAGCFYDHRITQAIQARRARAKEAEGARIASGSERPALPAHRTGRVRFYVADAYRKQHPNWERQLEQLVEGTATVLHPSFGLRLEVSELHAWSPACDPGELAACLDELQQVPVDGQTEWVVGVLPADSRFVASFDELGLASLPGRHFLVRDVSDLAERAAIDDAFASYGVARRDEIYARRKEHKRLAVFLHEWAHSVGGLHAPARGGLLMPRYDDGMSDFDSDNRALLAASLDDAFAGAVGHPGLRAALEAAPADAFAGDDRAELLARLASAPADESDEDDGPAPDAPLPAPTGHPYVVSGDESTLLSGLRDADRAAYRASVARLQADDLQGAIDALWPIVEATAGNYAVQHLACGLAMQAGDQANIKHLCARAEALSHTQAAASR